ncbi:MAG TPA: hypothetical protein VFD58_15205 [Blastocatellia bacterium]|nr:hypothetical protein [Blastocatellia bacterium]
MVVPSNSAAAREAEKVTPFLRDRLERQSAQPPRPTPQLVEAAPGLALPTLATPGDIRELVRYLRKKPAGVTIVEAMDATRKKTLHPGKIPAYEFLGLVEREGDRLRLSPQGWDFAGKLQPEARAFRDVITLSAPYRSLLEWIHGQQLDLVTQTDVAAYWQKHHAGEHGLGNEKTVTASIVCFFHLCQAAELGAMTIGKRGQPARLKVDREELAACLLSRETTDDATSPAVKSSLPAPVTAASEKPRVLISCRKEAGIIDQIRMALEVADIESEVSERSEDGLLPISEKTFQAMRRCQAAIIVMTEDDCRAEGDSTLSRRLLVEISSAFVLYNRQIVLLHDARLPAPDGPGEFCQCDFSGGELSWAAGMRLVRAVRNFRRESLR